MFVTRITMSVLSVVACLPKTRGANPNSREAELELRGSLLRDGRRRLPETAEGPNVFERMGLKKWGDMSGKEQQSLLKALGVNPLSDKISEYKTSDPQGVMDELERSKNEVNVVGQDDKNDDDKEDEVPIPDWSIPKTIGYGALFIFLEGIGATAINYGSQMDSPYLMYGVTIIGAILCLLFLIIWAYAPCSEGKGFGALDAMGTMLSWGAITLFPGASIVSIVAGASCSDTQSDVSFTFIWLGTVALVFSIIVIFMAKDSCVKKLTCHRRTKAC